MDPDSVKVICIFHLSEEGGISVIMNYPFLSLVYLDYFQTLQTLFKPHADKIGIWIKSEVKIERNDQMVMNFDKEWMSSEKFLNYLVNHDPVP